MNPEHEIYRAPEGEIPLEDTARLDGYLAAKAEETELKKQREKFEALLADIKDSA